MSHYQVAESDGTMGVWAIVCAVLLPLVGLILGLVCWTGDRPKNKRRGIVATFLSIFSAIIWSSSLANLG